MKKEMISFLQQNIGASTAGHIQGFGGWLNGKIHAVSDEGDIQLEFEVREEWLNPLGTLHGGMMASLADEVMGMQLFVKSGQDDAYFALNISVDFVKNAKLGEKLRAVPRVLRIGRRTATLSCEIYNEQNKPVAQATSNFLKLEN